VRGRERALGFGLDDPRVARERLPHAADSKYCIVCGTANVYAAAYVGHLGDWRCPGCGLERPPLDVAARAVELDGLAGAAFDLATPQGTRRVELALPGLYNVYNAVAAAALALVLGASLDEIAAGIGRFRAAFGRFERIQAGDRGVLLLLVKNPAGANEVVPALEQALDRGLTLTPAGGELVVLPTYTAMLALRGIAAGRGLVRQYWEAAA
jgi:UDP-N-acetylmuramyl tripeptide synthase